MKRLFTFSIVAFLVIVLCVQAGAQISEFTRWQLQYTLDSMCAKNGIKGASAAVLIPGEGIWKGTSGYSHDTVRIQSEMALGMGSNTKTFVSILLLKLQTAGLVDLDDSIGKWIQGYPNINGQATIRQCLNHTSGLRDYLGNPKLNDSLSQNPGKIWTKEEILTLPPPPDFEPGADWLYSNTNYIVAGIIIEQVSGQTVEMAMRQYVTDSAGYTHTFFRNESVSTPIPHQWTINLTGFAQIDLTSFPVNLIPHLYSLATSAGAMMTTAEDNVQFWYDLAKGNLLTPSEKSELTQIVPINSSFGYGLGIFRIRDIPRNILFYSHGGTFIGSINENMVDTLSGITVSVLTNQDSIGNDNILEFVVGPLFDVAKNRPPVSVHEVSAATEYTLFPVPTRHRLFLSPQTHDTEIILTDVQGKVCVHSLLTQEGIDVSELETGIYIAHLRVGTHAYHQKVIIR